MINVPSRKHCCSQNQQSSALVEYKTALCFAVGNGSDLELLPVQGGSLLSPSISSSEVFTVAGARMPSDCTSRWNCRVNSFSFEVLRFRGNVWNLYRPTMSDTVAGSYYPLHFNRGYFCLIQTCHGIFAARLDTDFERVMMRIVPMVLGSEPSFMMGQTQVPLCAFIRAALLNSSFCVSDLFKTTFFNCCNQPPKRPARFFPDVSQVTFVKQGYKRVCANGWRRVDRNARNFVALRSGWDYFGIGPNLDVRFLSGFTYPDDPPSMQTEFEYACFLNVLWSRIPRVDCRTFHALTTNYERAELLMDLPTAPDYFVHVSQACTLLWRVFATKAFLRPALHCDGHHDLMLEHLHRSVMLNKIPGPILWVFGEIFALKVDTPCRSLRRLTFRHAYYLHKRCFCVVGDNIIPAAYSALLTLVQQSPKNLFVCPDEERKHYVANCLARLLVARAITRRPWRNCADVLINNTYYLPLVYECDAVVSSVLNHFHCQPLAKQAGSEPAIDGATPADAATSDGDDSQAQAYERWKERQAVELASPQPETKKLTRIRPSDMLSSAQGSPAELLASVVQQVSMPSNVRYPLAQPTATFQDLIDKDADREFTAFRSTPEATPEPIVATEPSPPSKLTRIRPSDMLNDALSSPAQLLASVAVGVKPTVSYPLLAPGDVTPKPDTDRWFATEGAASAEGTIQVSPEIADKLFVELAKTNHQAVESLLTEPLAAELYSSQPIPTSAPDGNYAIGVVYNQLFTVIRNPVQDSLIMLGDDPVPYDPVVDRYFVDHEWLPYCDKVNMFLLGARHQTKMAFPVVCRSSEPPSAALPAPIEPGLSDLEASFQPVKAKRKKSSFMGGLAGFSMLLLWAVGTYLGSLYHRIKLSLAIGRRVSRAKALWHRFDSPKWLIAMDHVLWAWRLLGMFASTMFMGKHDVKCPHNIPDATDEFEDVFTTATWESNRIEAFARLSKTEFGKKVCERWSKLPDIAEHYHYVDWDGVELVEERRRVLRVPIVTNWLGELPNECFDENYWFADGYYIEFFPLLPGTRIDVNRDACAGCVWSSYAHPIEQYYFDEKGERKSLTETFKAILWYLFVAVECLIIIIKSKMKHKLVTIEVDQFLLFANLSKTDVLRERIKKGLRAMVLTGVGGIFYFKIFRTIEAFVSDRERLERKATFQPILMRDFVHSAIGACLVTICRMVAMKPVCWLTCDDVGREFKQPKTDLIVLFDRNTKAPYMIRWQSIAGNVQASAHFVEHKLYWQTPEFTEILVRTADPNLCGCSVCTRFECGLCSVQTAQGTCFNCAAYFGSLMTKFGGARLAEVFNFTPSQVKQLEADYLHVLKRDFKDDVLTAVRFEKWRAKFPIALFEKQGRSYHDAYNERDDHAYQQWKRKYEFNERHNEIHAAGGQGKAKKIRKSKGKVNIQKFKPVAEYFETVDDVLRSANARLRHLENSIKKEPDKDVAHVDAAEEARHVLFKAWNEEQSLDEVRKIYLAAFDNNNIFNEKAVLLDYASLKGEESEDYMNMLAQLFPHSSFAKIANVKAQKLAEMASGIKELLETAYEAGVSKQERRRLIDAAGEATQAYELFANDGVVKKQCAVPDCVLRGDAQGVSGFAVDQFFVTWVGDYIYVLQHYFNPPFEPWKVLELLKRVRWTRGQFNVRLQFSKIFVSATANDVFRVQVRVFDGSNQVLLAPAIGLMKEVPAFSEVRFDYRSIFSGHAAQMNVTVTGHDDFDVEDSRYKGVYSVVGACGEPINENGCCGLPYFTSVVGIHGVANLVGIHIAGAANGGVFGLFEPLGGHNWGEPKKPKVVPVLDKQGNAGSDLQTGSRKSGQGKSTPRSLNYRNKQNLLKSTSSHSTLRNNDSVEQHLRELLQFVEQTNK